MAGEKSKNLTADRVDVFEAKAIGIADRLARNPKPLAIAGGIILAALVAGYGAYYIVQAKQEDRKIALTKVDEVFEAENKKYQAEREAVEKQRDALIAAQPASATPGQPPAETPEIKALSDKIQAIKPEHKESAEKYKAFFEANSTHPEGWAAGLKYAGYAVQQKDLEGAQKTLETIVKGSKDHPVLHTQSLLLLISVLEDRAEFDKALEHSDTLLKTASEELKPRALLTKAQIYYLKKDFGNARANLEKLLSDHGSSPEAERARGLLALIPA